MRMMRKAQLEDPGVMAMEFLINPDGTRGRKFERGIDQSWMINSNISSQFNELPIFNAILLYYALHSA